MKRKEKYLESVVKGMEIGDGEAEMMA